MSTNTASIKFFTERHHSAERSHDLKKLAKRMAFWGWATGLWQLILWAGIVIFFS